MADSTAEPTTVEVDNGHLVINRYMDEAIKIEAKEGQDILIEVIDILEDETQRTSVRLRVTAPKSARIHRSTRTLRNSSYDFTPKNQRDFK